MTIVLDHVSPSSRNRFRTCPFSWKLQKLGVKGISTDNRALVFGGGTHRFIAAFYKKIPESPTYQEIASIAKETYEEIVVPLNVQDYRQKGEDILNNFIGFEIKRKKTWKVYKPSMVEEPLKATLTTPSGNIINIEGIIDFYGDRKGIDWKSGGSGIFPEDRMFQGKTYELLLRALSLPLDKFIFMNLHVGQFLETPNVSDGWYFREVDTFINMVKNGNFPKNSGGLCDNCFGVLECNLSETSFWSDLFWGWANKRKEVAVT